MDVADGSRCRVGAGAGERDCERRACRCGAATRQSAPGFISASLAAITLVLFGLTIVVKRVPSAYAVPEDDDI